MLLGLSAKRQSIAVSEGPGTRKRRTGLFSAVGNDGEEPKSWGMLLEWMKGLCGADPTDFLTSASG